MDLVSLLTSTTSKGNPNAWDISKAYYDAGADAWDVSKAFYSNVNKSVATQDTLPTGLFFKPDGTKMYIIGRTGDDVNEYTLSTPWLVSSASYVQNFSVAGQETIPTDLFFKPDGTKMYVVGSANDSVYEYSLSSVWDISTASYVQNFSVNAQDSAPGAVSFKPDGTKMYVLGSTGDDVNEYDLSTPWDISTASYLQNFSVAGQETDPQGLFFKNDGTKMYVVGTSGDDINEYDLSSAWDISTASYLQNFSIAGQETGPYGIFFHPDGSGFYIVGEVNDTVYQYTIGGFSVAAQDSGPEAVFFKPDGTKMYISGNAGNDINEYDLSTAWDVTTASYVQNFAMGIYSVEAPKGLFFKPDGTKMYVTGLNSSGFSRIWEWSLSSAWDISSTSYVGERNILSTESDPTGIYIKSDGLKLYLVGAGGDAVKEFTLGAAWDVLDVGWTLDSTFSISSQDTTPSGLFFKTDGTKMYVVGDAGNDINEYSLSGAWDISTASYVQNFSVASQESAPQGLFWKDDGSQFWIVGSARDRVFSYLISPT